MYIKLEKDSPICTKYLGYHREIVKLLVDCNFEFTKIYYASANFEG
jgi:hypothetical protein